MATLKLYNKSGDAKAVRVQESIEKSFGFIPETFQAMGANGDFLERVLSISQAAGKILDPKTKELIAIAVSAANGCEYCVAAHSASARQAGVTDEEITAAIEVAAMMSMYNTFNKTAGLNIDIK